MKAGILEARGTFVICDEIDLCDTDFYARALALLERSDADMVVGSKVMEGAERSAPAVPPRSRRACINGMLRVTCDFHGTDTHGLKAFRREALLDTSRRCLLDRDLFASEFVIRAEREGKRVRRDPHSPCARSGRPRST